MPSIVATLSIIALLGIQTVYTQRVPAVVGCLEVGCPTKGADNNDSTCTVADTTYDGNVIGFARISTSTNITGVSWTEGITMQDRDTGENYHTNYYFGTPPDKNFTGTGACAVFFHEVSDLVVFPNNNNADVSEGTCDEAMTGKCTSALKDQAEKVDVNGLGTSEACAKIQTAFTENFNFDCEGIATGKNWTGITATALTGPDAAAPISGTQNSSSNCWPVVPKENSLSLVASTDIMGSDTVNSRSENLFKITPILTLFYPGNGSLITKSEAQMTCLKTINSGVGNNATQSNGKDSAGIWYRPTFVTVITCLSLLIGLNFI